MATAPLSPLAFHLSWSPYDYCPNVAAIRVYRKTGSNPYQPDPCETGVRPGYQLIAELDGTSTSFQDTNGGVDFEQGVDYCYRLVAVFHGGAESQPSDEVCVRQQNNRPLMTQVSNDSRDLFAGHLCVGWARPQEIESFYLAPYSYKLIRVMNGKSTEVYSGGDTLFFDEEVDLAEVRSLSYQVEMNDANHQVIGTSAVAEAVLLSGSAGDESVSLTWSEAVPWIVDSTEIFRAEDSVFVRIALTEHMSYKDTLVENEVRYRYYVRTFGHYSLEGIQQPLVNYSAVIEATPSENEDPEPGQPVYELPNVFTPNGDGINDVFEPMQVTPDLITGVTMHIFNRWGRPVFDTDDVYIHWDGRVQGTRMPCPDGTYFYVCDVEMKTPEGLVSKRLQGVIMIVRN